MTRPTITSPQELELCRDDPHREGKLFIVDYVVCRKCGAQLSLIFKQHLAKDGYVSLEQYQQEWNGAPIYSIRGEAEKYNWYFDHKTDVIAAATQWNKVTGEDARVNRERARMKFVHSVQSESRPQAQP